MLWDKDALLIGSSRFASEFREKRNPSSRKGFVDQTAEPKRYFFWPGFLFGFWFWFWDWFWTGSRTMPLVVFLAASSAFFLRAAMALLLKSSAIFMSCAAA